MDWRRRAIRRTRPQELVGHMLLDVFVLLQLVLMLASLQLQLMLMMLLASSRLCENSNAATSFAPKAPRDGNGLTVQRITLKVRQRHIASPMSGRTIESLSPVGQLYAKTTTLVRICREAVAVAMARGALADIHVARGDVVLGIKSTITVTKYFRIAQRAAIEVHCPLVARRLCHNVLLGPRTRLGATHLP